MLYKFLVNCIILVLKMSRSCFITGKGVLSGNNVSHSNRKTRRRFLPNLKMVSLMSDALGDMIRMRISMRGLRIIESSMGIDSYLMNTPNDKLSVDARMWKRKIKKILDLL